MRPSAHLHTHVHIYRSQLQPPLYHFPLPFPHAQKSFGSAPLAFLPTPFLASGFLSHYTPAFVVGVLLLCLLLECFSYF